MRRIVTFQWLTADGRVAGPDGNLDWVVPDDAQARSAAADIAGVDTALFGRRTYEIFERFWRHALDDSATAPDPHRPGARSREHRTIAVALNEMTKLVFSRTLPAATWRNARVVRELDTAALAAMKRQPGKDMILFGSGSVVTQLTAAGLIDEYRLGVCPVFLGTGQPLLGGLPASVKLELAEARPLPSGDGSPPLSSPRRRPLSSSGGPSVGGDSYVRARRRRDVPRPMKMMLAVQAAISGGRRSARAKARATKWTTR
jgi:dihydrofolate reductase